MADTKVENPFVMMRDKPQHLSWKHLKNNIEYYIELILPFKAIVQELQREGAYMVVCAEVVEDQEIQIMDIKEGHLMVLDFAMRTFSRAWEATPYIFRKDFKEDDNLRIRFIKDSRQSMRIVDVQKMEPKKEHLEFADKVYNNPYDYIIEKINVRGRRG